MPHTPVNLAGNAAQERVKRKRQPPAKFMKTPAKSTAKVAGGQKVSPAVGSAATSDATHTQEDEPFEDRSWEGLREQVEAVPVPEPLNEHSEEEVDAPPPKKRRTKKERSDFAVSSRTGSYINDLLPHFDCSIVVYAKLCGARHQAKEQADALVLLKNLLTEQSLQDARARPAPQTAEEKRDLQEIENARQLMAQELALVKMQNEQVSKGLEEAKAVAERARPEGKHAMQEERNAASKREELLRKDQADRCKDSQEINLNLLKRASETEQQHSNTQVKVAEARRQGLAEVASKFEQQFKHACDVLQESQKAERAIASAHDEYQKQLTGELLKVRTPNYCYA